MLGVAPGSASVPLPVHVSRASNYQAPAPDEGREAEVLALLRENLHTVGYLVVVDFF